MTRRAFLGLGSNLGQRVMYLRTARDAIADRKRVSSLYETDPWVDPDHGDVRNMGSLRDQ